MIVAEDSRTTGCLHADHTQVVFDGDWDTGERARGILGTLQCALAINGEKCVEGIVQFFCGVDRGFDSLTRHGFKISFVEGDKAFYKTFGTRK
jgi:hypothetical protein